MTACIPLSETLRISFQFSNSPPAAVNHSMSCAQQRAYPRVQLIREYTRSGMFGVGAMGISAGRPEYIEMSWDEYCCLTQSKLLAVNILSFRDYTNTQSGPKRYHTIVPAQYRTAHTATGNTCPFRTNTTNIPNNLSYSANNLNNGPSFPVPPPYNAHFGNRNCSSPNATNI